MNKISQNGQRIKFTQNCQKLLKQLHSGAWLLQLYCTSTDHVRWPGGPGGSGPDDCCHGSQRSHGKGWEVAVVHSGGLGLGWGGCGVCEKKWQLIFTDTSLLDIAGGIEY